MALRVGAPRDRHADEIHRRRRLAPVGVAPEHDGADLNAPDTAGFVERDRERLSGIGERRDVREERSRVDVHGVPACGFHDRHPGAVERVGEIFGRADPITQVIRFDGLRKALRDRLEIPAGEPAVGREALGEDQKVAAFLGERVVVHREPSADVRERILLCAHRHPVGVRRHLAHDVADLALGVPGLA